MPVVAEGSGVGIIASLTAMSLLRNYNRRVAAVIAAEHFR